MLFNRKSKYEPKEIYVNQEDGTEYTRAQFWELQAVKAQNQVKQLKKHNDSLQKFQSLADQRLDIIKKQQGELDYFKGKVKENASLISQHRDEIDDLQEKLNVTQAQIDRDFAVYAQENDRFDAKRREVLKLQEKLDDTQGANKDLQEKLDVVQSHLNKKIEAFRLLNISYQEKNREIQQLEDGMHKLRLKMLEDRLEGDVANYRIRTYPSGRHVSDPAEVKYTLEKAIVSPSREQIEWDKVGSYETFEEAEETMRKLKMPDVYFSSHGVMRKAPDSEFYKVN